MNSPISLPTRESLRLAPALAAVAVAAWFGLGWVQARDTQRAATLVSAANLSPAQAQAATSLLSSAGTLNPDRAVDLLRAQLASDQHHNRQALAILRSVTRAEPLNFEAWKAFVDAAALAGRRHLATVTFVHLESLLAKPR